MRILSKKLVNADKVKDALAVAAFAGIMVAGFWIAQGLGIPFGLDDLAEVV